MGKQQVQHAKHVNAFKTPWFNACQNPPPTCRTVFLILGFYQQQKYCITIDTWIRDKNYMFPLWMCIQPETVQSSKLLHLTEWLESITWKWQFKQHLAKEINMYPPDYNGISALSGYSDMRSTHSNTFKTAPDHNWNTIWRYNWRYKLSFM